MRTSPQQSRGNCCQAESRRSALNTTIADHLTNYEEISGVLTQLWYQPSPDAAQVSDMLQRIAGVADICSRTLPIVGAAQRYRYRNKMEVMICFYSFAYEVAKIS